MIRRCTITLLDVALRSYRRAREEGDTAIAAAAAAQPGVCLTAIVRRHAHLVVSWGCAVAANGLLYVRL